MPAGGQGQRFGVGALGCGQQVGAQDAVADDQPAGDPQAHPRGGGEERVDGLGEMRSEDQRARRTGGCETADELVGHAGRVRGVGHPGFLGQRVLVEPFEQRHPHAADRADLREVHVGVHETGQHQAAGQVDDALGRVGAAQLGVRAAGGDHPVLDEQGGVGRDPEGAAGERVVWSVEERASEQRHASASR